MARLAPLLILFALAMPPACSRKEGANFVYEWLPTESAPKQFPVHLIRGDLFFKDGRSIYIPDGRDVSNGWGRRGSTHIVGEAMKPVPVRLELVWFSFTEDRFYQGSFDLPAEAMTALFKAGVTDPRTGRPLGFERIIVGMAPGGHVSVWMAAGAEVVEVAAFLAPEVSLPWKMVLDNPAVPRPVFIQQVLRERLGAEGLARLEREGVPRGIHPGYRAQYLWRPHVSGQGTPNTLWTRSFNGENAFTGAEGPAIPRDQRPVPAELLLDWTASAGGTLLAKIIFDEAEIFAAFTKLSRGDSSHPLALEVDVAENAVAVSLRDEKYLLPLEKTRVELFQKY